MRSKKLFALLLAAVMVFGSFSMAFAEEPVLLGAAPKTLGATVDAKLDLSDQVVILHSNDVHGAIAGYAYMKALKDWYAAAGAEVIVVDAGDFSQGSTYVSVSKGFDAVTMMNLVGYDYATLGNHEFDWGLDKILVYWDNVKSNGEATFPLLSANIVQKSTNKNLYDFSTSDEIEQFAIVEKGGAKVGLVSAIGPCEGSIIASAVADYKFENVTSN